MGAAERRAAREALRNWAMTHGVDNEDPSKIMDHVVEWIVRELKEAGFGPHIGIMKAGTAEYSAADWDKRDNARQELQERIETVRSIIQRAGLPKEVDPRVREEPQRVTVNDKQWRMHGARAIYVTGVVVEISMHGLGQRVIVAPTEKISLEAENHAVFAGVHR